MEEKIHDVIFQSEKEYFAQLSVNKFAEQYHQRLEYSSSRNGLLKIADWKEIFNERLVKVANNQFGNKTDYDAFARYVVNECIFLEVFEIVTEEQVENFRKYLGIGV